METNNECKDCSLIEKCPYNHEPLLWTDNDQDRMAGRGVAERCHTSLTHREIKHPSSVKPPNVQF